MVVSMAAVLFVSGGDPFSDQVMSISIPSLAISKEERVVGFEVHITSGRIAELPNVPIGWSISVDNSPSWNTVIKGSTLVGAAALDPDFFTDFLVVEKNESLGLAFDVRGEVVVTRDFIKERRINVGLKDLVLAERAARKPPERR